MRIPLAAIVGAGVALVAASMLGVASAEAPTTALTRSIDVQGVAKAPVGQGANAAAATAAYRTAMASAVADAQNKAEFLAAKAGVTLGAPQTIAEDGGFIDCAGGGESGFVEYEGEQPDFGTAGPAVGGVRLAAPAAPAAAPVRPKPAIKRRHRKHRRTAKTALSATCTLTAQVSIAYAIS